MARRIKPVRLDIRLYPGQDDDLIAWVQGLAHQPYGAKMQQVRTALRRGLTDASGPAPAALDLAAVRQVVEAALATALARFEGHVMAAPRPAAEDDEAEALLDDLGSVLRLQE